MAGSACARRTRAKDPGHGKAVRRTDLHRDRAPAAASGGSTPLLLGRPRRQGRRQRPRRVDGRHRRVGRPGPGRGRRDRRRRGRGRRQHRRHLRLGRRRAPRATRRSTPSAGSTSWSTTPASSATGCSSTWRRPSGTPSSRCTSRAPSPRPATPPPTGATGPRPVSEVDARLINTTSVSGIYGNPGQTNYGAAKMGIAAFTIIAAQELERYGVTVNAIAPGRPHPHDRGPRRLQAAHARAAAADGGRQRARSGSRRSACGSRRPSHARSPAASSRRRARSSPWPRAGTAARRPSRPSTPRPSAPSRMDLAARARPNADMSGQDKGDHLPG